MKVRHVIASTAALSAAWLALASPAAAAGPVHVAATINGQSVAGASADHPIRLDPQKPAQITLSVTADHAVTIHRVELSGRVVGLTFYSFDTSVSLAVAAGTPATLGYSLDLTGLKGQATGLIGGSITLFDDHGHQVAQQTMISDVRGSLYSVYGLFGFALLVLTILALLDTALAMARHRMPANRWRRGLRFMTPGIGIGLVLVFTLSATRVWVPSAGRWLLFGVGFAVVFFVLGYLSPTPVSDADADEDDDDWDDDESPPLTLPGFTPTTLPAVHQLSAPTTTEVPAAEQTGPLPVTTSTFVPSRWPDPPPPVSSTPPPYEPAPLTQPATTVPSAPATQPAPATDPEHQQQYTPWPAP